MSFVLSATELEGSTTQESIIVNAMSPAVMESEVTNVFDLEALQNEFTKICPDYKDDITLNTASLALSYAHKVIYDVGPKSRGKVDKAFTLILNSTSDETQKGHKVQIRTFKGGMKVVDRLGLLTVKRATLLAMPVFNRAAVALYSQDEKPIVLTPLAAATFSAKNVENIAKVINESVVDTICMLNSSACSGGQVLDNSYGPFAVMCAISATRTKSDEVRDSVIGKTVKSYSVLSKLTSGHLDKIAQIAHYANGGVPEGFSVSELLKLFNENKSRPVAPAKLNIPDETVRVTQGTSKSK